MGEAAGPAVRRAAGAREPQRQGRRLRLHRQHRGEVLQGDARKCTPAVARH